MKSRKEKLPASPGSRHRNCKQVRGLGEHEQHAAGRAVGVVLEGAGRRCSGQPDLHFLLGLGLQGIEQVGEAGLALRVQDPQHIGDEDAAGFQPDIVIALAGFGNELAGDAVGIGGVRDLREWRPVCRARIERIEDHVAAFGPVIVRDEFAAGVIDQRRFAARLDLVEHLAQHRGLARSGRPGNREVAAFEPWRNADRGDAQAIAHRFPVW